ncbi:MAG: hypothetical protein COU07_02910 [Candidatus Harrisonbacteria bacterium CG10_big_fil_rev_8_21_14_0_10_40_38]|uniref:Vitamin K epoxide reductase domain-containing protein n=1 Tax=Candidatus Harrisonbacteria bacterium CG10_big_fil_rev_8_21_14_0_10_40_38 TaxID=1974583 RepID=A0A2H0UU31_9BACT|nr:MAG: hypothetical protein COU07_02910 [Candidatus Harrisonbacteria bacterium CG10_big_fil_rev_8_21_14_0_10_40_38]
MTNLEHSLIPKSKKTHKVALVALFVAAILGFCDATYLTAEHFLQAIPPCTIVNGCETVLTSPYATPFLGIPLALIGAVFYLTVFLFLIFYRETKSALLLKLIFGISILGFVATLFFVYLQVFVISALCLYCLFSAITSTTLFVSAIFLKRSYETPHEEPQI